MNLYEQQPGIAAELRAALAEFVGSEPLRAASASPNLEVDEEALRMLAALGYVTTRGERPLDPASLMDPKDGVHHWERVQSGVYQKNSGDVAGAIETLEDCVKEVPNDVFALQILAGAYQIQGRYADALEIVRVAEQLEPSDPGLRLIAGSVHLHLGEVDVDAPLDAPKTHFELQGIPPEATWTGGGPQRARGGLQLGESQLGEP